MFRVNSTPVFERKSGICHPFREEKCGTWWRKMEIFWSVESMADPKRGFFGRIMGFKTQIGFWILPRAEMSPLEPLTAKKGARRVGAGGSGVGQQDLGWDIFINIPSLPTECSDGWDKSMAGKSKSLVSLCRADESSCLPLMFPTGSHPTFPKGSCPDIPKGILPPIFPMGSCSQCCQ